MNETKYFPKGLYFKEPNPNAPDFVKGKVSIKVDEFKAYLNNVKGEYLNIDLKVSKDGKAYAEVDTWKPDPNKDIKPPVNDPMDASDSSLPF
jgi:hypothetical protein